MECVQERKVKVRRILEEHEELRNSERKKEQLKAQAEDNYFIRKAKEEKEQLGLLRKQEERKEKEMEEKLRREEKEKEMQEKLRREEKEKELWRILAEKGARNVQEVISIVFEEKEPKHSEQLKKVPNFEEYMVQMNRDLEMMARSMKNKEGQPFDLEEFRRLKEDMLKVLVRREKKAKKLRQDLESRPQQSKQKALPNLNGNQQAQDEESKLEELELKYFQRKGLKVNQKTKADDEDFYEVEDEKKKNRVDGQTSVKENPPMFDAFEKAGVKPVDRNFLIENQTKEDNYCSKFSDKEKVQNAAHSTKEPNICDKEHVQQQQLHQVKGQQQLLQVKEQLQKLRQVKEQQQQLLRAKEQQHKMHQVKEQQQQEENAEDTTDTTTPNCKYNSNQKAIANKGKRRLVKRKMKPIAKNIQKHLTFSKVLELMKAPLKKFRFDQICNPRGGRLYPLSMGKVLENYLECDWYMWVNCGSARDPKTDGMTYYFNARTSRTDPMSSSDKFQKILYFCPEENKCLVHYIGDEKAGLPYDGEDGSRTSRKKGIEEPNSKFRPKKVNEEPKRRLLGYDEDVNEKEYLYCFCCC